MDDRINVSGAREQPEYFSLVIQAQTSDAVPKASREMVSEQGELALGAMVQLIQEGQAAGQVVRGDPHQLAMLLFALVQGAALSNASSRYRMPSFPDLDMVLRILKP